MGLRMVRARRMARARWVRPGASAVAGLEGRRARMAAVSGVSELGGSSRASMMLLT